MTDTFLQGPHLLLRALEPEDLEIMYTIENDTTTWDVSNVNVPYSKYALKQYITNSQYDVYADKQLRLMVVRRDNNQVVGAIDLCNFEPLHRRAEVGIVMLKAHRGQGYATEALQLLCQYTFRFLCLQQLTAHISTDNTESLHLFEHNGFVACGTLKRWWNVGGTYKDVTLLQRLRPQEKNDEITH